ncbi:hypothetical protein, partial [Pantoea sp.]|uniref:hypothetical protein n=1 Tax=Pantoea sp. TaxID=69393 RepID=UPI0028AA7B80
TRLRTERSEVRILLDAPYPPDLLLRCKKSPVLTAIYLRHHFLAFILKPKILMLSKHLLLSAPGDNLNALR